MSQIPSNLRYTKTHEWYDPATGKVGITDYAQNALGDLVFVNLPSVGDSVTAEKVFADVESVKAVADLNSPVTGKIIAVNDDLSDTPEKLNSAPYESWIATIGEVGSVDGLMSANEYEEFTK